MAVVSNLKTYPMSLIWETERPSSRSMRSRQSSCFRLFGEEWHLKLDLYLNAYTYVEEGYQVYLCSRNGKNSISGLCFVITNTAIVIGSGQFFVQNPGGVILTLDRSHNTSSTTAKWKIHCHFTSGIDSQKTNHLSTGSSPTSSKTYFQDLQDLRIGIPQDHQHLRVGIPPDLQLLSDDLSRLLDKEIIPDATLTCGGKTWRVHRSVLTVRSEVFGAMFRSGMSESETGAVRVEDLEPTVLDSVLKYVYGGNVPDVSGKNVSGLYEAADRYALHGLRKQLSSWMAEHLSLENCLGFLVLADAHSDAELKDATVAFIAKHFSEIEKAVWAKFRKEHLHLVVEVLEHFAPAMKK